MDFMFSTVTVTLNTGATFAIYAHPPEAAEPFHVTAKALVPLKYICTSTIVFFVIVIAEGKVIIALKWSTLPEDVALLIHLIALIQHHNLNHLH